MILTLNAGSSSIRFALFAPAADAREMGDLFEYRLAQPVTIRKSESAMLPCLQQKIDARKLLI